MSILETHNLGIRFGGLWALKGVDLSLADGEIHGLIGPNGSGKSTLFHLVVGRHTPTTGNVSYKGKSLARLSPSERTRLGIAIKFQITSLFEGLTVGENIQMGTVGRQTSIRRLIWGTAGRDGLSKEENDELEILELIGLRDRRGDLAGNLSHGEKQWLEIGMALAANPDLLLLDEPTSGMGTNETRKTAELVLRLRESRTILVIEHDMEFVRQVADSITVLSKGEVLTEGTYASVKDDQRVIEAYLGKGRVRDAS